MADWKHRIDLEPEWSQRGDFTIQQLAKIVAARLRAVKILSELLALEQEDIAEDFDEVADNEDATVQDFDDAMRRLYDWGDTKLPAPAGTPFSRQPKLCWINT